MNVHKFTLRVGSLCVCVFMLANMAPVKSFDVWSNQTDLEFACSRPIARIKEKEIILS